MKEDGPRKKNEDLEVILTYQIRTEIKTIVCH
jgi:hypothetical protein